jgi:DNA-binding CsgD family transcriptional regulator
LFADGIHHNLTRGTIKQRKLNLFLSLGVLNQAEAVFEATATVSA